MKIVAVLMVLVGLMIAAGGALEFWYYGPESRQFWVAVFATPAGVFFSAAGVLLWLRGFSARRLVLIASAVMAAATVAATALGVMGPPAWLPGLGISLLAVVWVWRAREVAA